jgi:hypothetical protein
MTLRSEIRGALAAGNKTAEQLVGLCDSAADSKAMANNLYILKKEGKVKIVGSIEGRNNYGIDDWPEKAIRGTGKRAEAAPPPKRAYKKRKASGSRAAEAAATPVAPANGAASFAILDNGMLSLIKQDRRVDLDPEEFTRLRKFIESTDSIWNT